jgi:hypothetical protein
LIEWLRAFALTQMVEMGAYAHASERPLRERLAIAFGASALTHPIVFFVIPHGVAAFRPTGDYRTDWWIGVAIAELFAFSAEAIWLAIFGTPPLAAIAWSFYANASSFCFGIFGYRRLDWS